MRSFVPLTVTVKLNISLQKLNLSPSCRLQGLITCYYMQTQIIRKVQYKGLKEFVSALLIKI